MPDEHLRTLVITAAYTGMRFGELAGLCRANVHLDGALIHVSDEWTSCLVTLHLLCLVARLIV
jgi:integrase